MDLESFKKQFIRDELGITNEYGRIFTFVDFGNVNNWFAEDRQNADFQTLGSDEKLEINITGLKDFSYYFSTSARFYYGHDPANQGSMGFLRKTRDVFGKSKVFTKPLQKVRHHLKEEEKETNTRSLFHDNDGDYILLPKCNFDVEISVDAIKLSEHYDTFCLFSGDADFVYLNSYLRNKGKKIILIKGGHITDNLRKSADKVINAQNIKKHITQIKQKPGG